ncbi:MAG: hypothetical protein KC550_01160 [Nanoarchaeota archaeon]|nr:hypothetical protein [Nanoarchaeota archaeon]
MNTEIFKELGLNNREIDVYIILVREGELNASKIASFTKINRTTVYLELNNLINKGLVNTVVKNSKKFFNAAPPEKILDILEERKRKANDAIIQLNSLKKSQEKTKIQYFEGKEGVKNLYLDAIKENKNILVFGGTGIGFSTFKFYYPQIYREVKKKNIGGRMIVNEDVSKEFELNYRDFSVDIKYMPKEFSSLVTTIIYGDKVALQSLQEGNIYFLLIEDKNLADSYRNTFEFMWKNLK